MMKSADLSQSIYEIQQTPIAQEKVGSEICDTMNKMLAGAIALKKIGEVASEHGNRVVCTGVTLASGLGCLAHGNLVMGGMMTLVGAKEAINIWREANPTGDLASLLNNANAGVSMVKTLEEANSESFKVVDANLSIIRNNTKKMNDRMDKIKAISTEGQKDIEEIKAKASDLYEESQDLFETAQASFEHAQARFKQANKIFVRSMKQFDELFQLAETTDIADQEKLDEFIKIAHKIQKQCAAAQIVLKEGNQDLEKGLQSLDVAMEKEREAYGESMVAMERVKNKLELIDAQAKIEDECKQKIEETQGELVDIQERNKEIKGLLGELEGDLKDAKKHCDDKFGNMSVFLGVIPGAVIGFGAAGIPGALAGGFGGGEIVHERNYLMRKVDALINGEISYKDANPNKKERVKIKFQDRSTGWYNRFIKKATQSYTAGQVEIKVGNQMISLPFNLNNDYKISKSDLYDLQQLLGKKVISGEISSQDCLDIISDLTNQSIDRGPGSRAQKGLISVDSPYLNELKRICKNILAREQKSVAQIVEESAG
jgi:hypothetical protein